MGAGLRSPTGTIRAMSRPRSVTSMVSPCRTRASTSLVWCRRSRRPTTCVSVSVTESLYHKFVATNGSFAGDGIRDSAVSPDNADRAGHAGAVVGAVAVRVLGVAQVLLVVI